MKTKYIIPVVLLCLSPACTTPGKMTVYPVNQLPLAEVPRKIYCLPQTSLKVEITILRETFVPGPYASFARQFLGIEGVSEEPYTNFRIIQSRIVPISEPDPQQFLALTGDLDPADLNEISKLESKGLILDPGIAGSPAKGNNFAGENFHPMTFPDISYRDHFREVTDTLFKTILEDSILVRIPVLRKLNELKTREEMAGEIAHLIHKLRKRRIKMVSADYPVLPQGEAMSASINELQRIEERYLGLFTGKIFTDTIQQQWTIVPLPEGQGESELCRFSDEEGFLPAGSGDGKAIILLVKPSGLTSGIPALPMNQPNTLYYRIPDSALVEVQAGNEVIASMKISLFQLGKLVPLTLSPRKKQK
jgi:hypothetical protein